MIQKETTWLNEEEEEEWEFSEKQRLQENDKITEVKIRITKKQLEKALTSNALEKVLEEIVSNGIVCHEHNIEGHWKPRLQSIQEVVEER